MLKPRKTFRMPYKPDLVAERIVEAVLTGAGIPKERLPAAKKGDLKKGEIKMSNVQLANLTGLSEGTIRNLKKGSKSKVQAPKISTFYKLAEFSGYSLLYLLGETDEPHDDSALGLSGALRKAEDKIDRLSSALEDALRQLGDGARSNGPQAG